LPAILYIDLSGKIFHQRNSVPKDLDVIKIADVLRKEFLQIKIAYLFYLPKKIKSQQLFLLSCNK